MPNWFNKSNHNYVPNFNDLPARYHPDYQTVLNYEFNLLAQEEASRGRNPYYGYHKAGLLSVAKTRAEEVIATLQETGMSLEDFYR